MTKITLTKSAPLTNIKRDYKASVTAVDTVAKTSPKGFDYFTTTVTFEYFDENKTKREKKLFLDLPQAVWNKHSIAHQLLDVAGVRYKDLKDGESLELDTDQILNTDCVIHIGATTYQFGDKVGQVKTYINNDGEEKLSSEVIGIFPFKDYGKTWTPNMEEDQKRLYNEFKDGNTPATAQDVANEFETKFDA